MLRLKFKQAAHVGGRDFSKGNHEISSDMEQKLSKDKHFHKLVKAGLVEEVEAMIQAKSAAQKSAELAKKMASLPAPTMGKKDEAPVEVPPSDEGSGEEMSQESESAPEDEAQDFPEDEMMSEGEESEESDDSEPKDKAKSKKKKSKR